MCAVVAVSRPSAAHATAGANLPTLMVHTRDTLARLPCGPVRASLNLCRSGHIAKADETACRAWFRSPTLGRAARLPAWASCHAAAWDSAVKTSVKLAPRRSSRASVLVRYFASAALSLAVRPRPGRSSDASYSCTTLRSFAAPEPCTPTTPTQQVRRPSKSRGPSVQHSTCAYTHLALGSGNTQQCGGHGSDCEALGLHQAHLRLAARTRHKLGHSVAQVALGIEVAVVRGAACENSTHLHVQCFDTMPRRAAWWWRSMNTRLGLAAGGQRV